MSSTELDGKIESETTKLSSLCRLCFQQKGKIDISDHNNFLMGIIREDLKVGVSEYVI